MGHRMDNYQDPVYLDECTCLKETDKALLIEYEGEEIWIPKSQIVYGDSEISSEGDEGVLAITQWIADEKGLS